MPGVKRVKLDSTPTTMPSLETCRELIQKVDNLLPRVGTREIKDLAVLESLGNMFSDKQVVRIMACRGTERTMGPPEQLHPLEAPFRKMMILRRNGDIQYEKNWERWNHLAKRQLIRPSHACRINITMFAKEKDKPTFDPEHSPNVISQESQSSQMTLPLTDNTVCRCPFLRTNRSKMFLKSN